MKKILILGTTGLLGSTLLKYFSQKKNFECFGIIRKNSDKKKLKYIRNVKLYKTNYKNEDSIKRIFAIVKPDLIINCIGVVKQLIDKNNISEIIKVNSFLPHYLSEIAKKQKKIKFVHFSTDCVFSGTKGNYYTTDLPDAKDIYGQSKFIGELKAKNTLTLRTSIIGHELKTKYSLLNWFLDQKKSVKGFKNAIFSGLTALEIAKVLHKFILPKKNLNGLYHLSGKPISKYDLLNIIKKVYNKDIKILIDKKIKINRTLNSNFLQNQIGYKPQNWEKLIREMYKFNMNK